MTFKDISTLGKFSISLPVAITAYTGYVLSDSQLSLRGLWVFGGIFMLSAAASALNQIQERQFDGLMNRTKNRPLPSGRVSVNEAYLLVTLFLVGGVLLLLPTTFSGLFWGLMGMFWYNAIYTPLKRVTAFSVFPGALVGAIPPVAGWMAAGGDLLDIRLHFLALFFFLGQMPHFWLLVIKYGEDYHRGGFPTLFDFFTVRQINRINLVWLVATFVSAMMLPFMNVVDGKLSVYMLLIFSVLGIGWVTSLFARQSQQQMGSIRQLFVGFNSFYLLVMIIISLDQINW